MLFEKASRLKLRFDTGKGHLTVEDLWDLPLTSSTGRANLDDIARELNKQIQSTEDVSFVNNSKKTDPMIQAKFELVLYIIKTRKAENEANAKAKENAEQKQRILQLIAEKKDDELKDKSPEELQAMLADLK